MAEEFAKLEEKALRSARNEYQGKLEEEKQKIIEEKEAKQRLIFEENQILKK